MDLYAEEEQRDDEQNNHEHRGVNDGSVNCVLELLRLHEKEISLRGLISYLDANFLLVLYSSALFT